LCWNSFQSFPEQKQTALWKKRSRTWDDEGRGDLDNYAPDKHTSKLRGCWEKGGSNVIKENDQITIH